MNITQLCISLTVKTPDSFDFWLWRRNKSLSFRRTQSVAFCLFSLI